MKKNHCANCGKSRRCRWSCTCLKATLDLQRHPSGYLRQHGKFYFCSPRCLAQYHQWDYVS